MTDTSGPTADRRPHVLILGGGFAGIYAARGLRDAPVRITLVDRRNHHLFQPMLYQVATSALGPNEIASPIRSVLRKQANVRVLLGEAEAIDPAAREVRLAGGQRLAYDHDGRAGPARCRDPDRRPRAPAHARAGGRGQALRRRAHRDLGCWPG